MEAVWWVLDFLRKNSLFANLKKCQFYKKEVWFLEYIISSQSIQIKDEKIEVVKNWPEPKLVQDIQVFIGFANFYRHFIWSFSKIAATLILMLKMIGSLNLAPRLGADDNEFVRGGSKVDDRNLSIKPKNAKSGI